MISSFFSVGNTFVSLCRPSLRPCSSMTTDFGKSTIFISKFYEGIRLESWDAIKLGGSKAFELAGLIAYRLPSFIAFRL
jgi:hypothetical protein